ncbi:M23 family metallopeptidase [Geotalea sp. SG265]|uniref:M23 family metallopeptidase n=1 Tax=Geotalea sp. SG265 TaxID=2922867 RepID=UPI001FB0443B|nr:M23 family metallopeptidase [Geotalea sp. SG265]
MNRLTLLLPVFFLVIIAVALFYFLGTPAPTVSLMPENGPIAIRRDLSLKLDAGRAILKKLTVEAIQGEKGVKVLVKDYPAAAHGATEAFNLLQSGLKEGPFTLAVEATSSPRRFGAERTVRKQYQFTFENKPPVVEVLSVAHNITRGGAAVVVYTISKEVEKSGVVFGNRFYPGYRHGGNFYVCFFPFPYDMDPDKYIPRVSAVDKAGNERVVGINYHLIPKNFPPDTIKLAPAFVDKIAAEFKDRYPQQTSPLEVFLKVNGEVRAQNRKTIAELGRRTSPVPLWEGVFLRMPNAAPLGGFAQTRTYIYEGKEVDTQTHLGFDLASLAHAAVPAANRGVVIFAGDLGIYGNCIVIDHGLGLQTIYGHLSRIAVKEGDKVEKGQTIGNTGATGMAGGDHLHFEVVISGESVNPIEWWDPSWIRNNVTGKLELVKGAGK